MDQPAPNPLIPGTPKDRTGAAGIMRRASAEIARRYAGLQRDVLALFDAIPTVALNAEGERVVAYLLTPEQMSALSAELQLAVERWIASGRDPAYSFWWSVYESDASQMGAAQSVANLTNLSEAYAAVRSIEAVVYSQPYRDRLAMAQIRSYDHFTGLAATQKADLAQVIGRAIVDGKSPRAARKEIMERLDVGKSRADLYAQTSIPGTLREARIAEADWASETLNIKIGLLWTSALKPTTRSWHASRHRRVFTSDEVRKFYSERGNKFNCFCSTTEALLDADGKPILTKKLQSTMANELAAWKKSQPA